MVTSTVKQLDAWVTSMGKEVYAAESLLRAWESFSAHKRYDEACAMEALAEAIQFSRSPSVYTLTRHSMLQWSYMQDLLESTKKWEDT